MRSNVTMLALLITGLGSRLPEETVNVIVKSIAME
jgi:hypothetical protein